MQHVVYYFLFSLMSVFTVNAQTNRTLHTDAEIQAYLDELYNDFQEVGFVVKHVSTIATNPCFLLEDRKDFVR